MVQVLPYVPGIGERLAPAIQQAGETTALAIQKKRAQSALDKLLNPQQQNQPGSPVQQMNQVAQEGQVPSYSPIESVQIYKKIEQLHGKGAADAFKDTQLAKEKMQFQEKKLALGETEDFRKDVNASYNNALSNELIYSRARELNKKDLAKPVTALLSDHFGIPISVLANPDSEEFEKLSNTLSRGVTQAYRGRILASEFDNFLKQIPTLLNSKEGRERVLKNLEYLDEPKKLQFKAYREIVKDNKGRVPVDISEQVAERMEPKLKQLATDFNKSLESLPKPKGFFEKKDQFEGQSPQEAVTSQVSVYDQSGKLVGTVDSSEVGQLPQGYQAR